MIAVVDKVGFIGTNGYDYLKEQLPNEDIRFFKNYKDIEDDIDKVEILMNVSKMDSDIIKKATNLKWISSYSSGVDFYDLELLEQMNIPLTNSRGAHIKQISEQVIGAMVHFSRNFHDAIKAKKANKWYDTMPLDELYSKNLLIIGTGNIGKEIARKAKIFEMNTYGIRFKESNEKIEYFDEVYNVKDLDNRLKGMDYIVLVVPSNENTYKMIKKEQFELMDKTAVFMNVGRGNTVDEEAFFDALENNTIKAGYTDVFFKEPIDKDSRAYKIDNLLFTPHTAGISPHTTKRVVDQFVENFKRYKKNEPLKNLVDKKLRY